jgi:hypothetical protein
MRDAGPPMEFDGANDMRELPRRDMAGFFMAEEGTGMDVEGRALPSGPSDARVRRRESIAPGHPSGAVGAPMCCRAEKSGAVIGTPCSCGSNQSSAPKSW